MQLRAFDADCDYPRLWQCMAHVRGQAERYGPSAKRHLRLSMLQLAAGDYHGAARQACLSLATGFMLFEGHHALGAALLGQALVQEGLLEPGPGPLRRRFAGTRELVRGAGAAFARCAAFNPTDEECAALANRLRAARDAADAELVTHLRSFTDVPAGP